jgi:DHA1 family tetracycline resistance protein-like MFS transporter
MAVATTYISDITEEQERTKRFGYMSACFGFGFIIGPVIGGLLGAAWLRGPFFCAAVLNGANFALVYFVLPESRDAAPVGRLALRDLNPVRPARWALGVRALAPLLGMALLFGLVGDIQGSVWVLYGADKYHWDALSVGLSLATFGLCHAGSQAVLTGPIKARFGDMGTIIIGVVFDSAALTLLVLATHGWVAFALTPVFAVGGVGAPALQSLTANAVGDERQGALQGVLASITSLTAIVGPLAGTAVYSSTKAHWIGAVWITAASLYLLMIPLLILARRALRDRIVLDISIDTTGA